jgi:hypothetical protein
MPRLQVPHHLRSAIRGFATDDGSKNTKTNDVKRIRALRLYAGEHS